ncbi:MAG: hypothetical protein RLO81_09215 [Fulvivirga sp.]|uniref:hypothetical protein n=1 Tax=Fulvivirga sp. TaxID=1931237 RepID=UPI0032EE3C3A
MKELFNIIFESSRERIKNPFIGSFIFAWIAFNWKAIIIILFSDIVVIERIVLITKDYSSLTQTLLLPLGFAAFYVGILPYIMWLFDWISKKSWRGRKQNLLEQQVFEIQSKQKIAEEESTLENIRARYRDKADLNKRITILTDQLNERDETNKMLKQEINSLKEEQFQLQELVKQQTDETFNQSEKEKFDKEYTEFKESDLFDFFRELGSSISIRKNIPNNMDHLVVEKFRHSGLIKEVTDNENLHIHNEFTKKGKYFWKKFITNLKIVKKQKDESDDLPF